MGVKSVAPKKKEEFVGALCHLTTISRVTLEEMGMEKLRLIYQSVRPQQSVKPLPTNWRRFAKSELQKLYAEKAKPWYGIPATNLDYLEWTKDRLIVELINYAEEIKDQMPAEEIDPLGPPTCPKCSVEMVERVNRSTREPFWGCLSFPHCRETMSKTVTSVPARASASQGKPQESGYAQQPTGLKAKLVVIDGTEEMDGNAVKRAIRENPNQ